MATALSITSSIFTKEMVNQMGSKQSLTSANLFFLWFGAAVSVAEILTGGYLADLGIAKGVWAILLGHLVGTALLVAAGLIGFNEKLPSIMSTRISFGKQGSYLISVINILQLIGWTAIMIIVGGRAINVVTSSLWNFDNIAAQSAVTGLLIGIWVISGFQGFKKLNMAAVFLLLILTIVLTVVLFKQTPGLSEVKSPGFFGTGFELSIIMPLSWFPLIADYSSLSETKKGAWVAPFAGYFTGSCWMYGIGMFGGIYSGSPDPTGMMLAANLGIIALLIIVLSTITTTFLDVHSAAISLLNIFPGIKRGLAGAGFALAGTLLAIYFPMEQYTSFLYILGSIFSPLISILLADYFILKTDSRKKKADPVAMASLAAGIIFYYLIKPLELITGPTLATILFTFLLHYLFRTVFKASR
jgi:putative hydroxymethylpyrimidine transporter CytX